MSLWARILGLVVLPALLVLGCERDDLTIGLPPNDNLFELGYFEYPLNVMQTQEDSIINQGTGRLLMGNYDDPLLGPITSIAYASIKPVGFSRPAADSGAVADSIVLTMRADYIYGGDQMNIDLSVWNLTFDLDGENNYRSNFEQPLTNSEQIGLVNQPFPVQTYKNDSSVVLKAYFEQEFADSLLARLIRYEGNFNTDGSNQDTFKVFLSGLAFIPEPANDGIVGIDLDNAETSMVLYYTDVNGDKETWAMEFDDNPESPEYYNYISVNETNFNRPGTPLETLTLTDSDFDVPGDYIYYQPATGLGITAETMDLLNLADTLENTVIQTASLEIGGIEVTDNRDLPSIIRIMLTNDSNSPQFYNNILRSIYQGSRSDTVDLSSQAFRNGALEEFLKYDEERNAYVADVTLFLQAYLEGRVDLTKLWFYDPRIAINASAWRAPKDSVRLKIFYTKPKI